MLIGLDVVSGETTLFEWMLMPKRMLTTPLSTCLKKKKRGTFQPLSSIEPHGK
jgi:hypothetical protein